MRISDWSSDVCSSDLGTLSRLWRKVPSLNLPTTSASSSFRIQHHPQQQFCLHDFLVGNNPVYFTHTNTVDNILACLRPSSLEAHGYSALPTFSRSEEHTSDLQSLMRISYAVFCLNTKNKNKTK